jgi:hypothetical protein
MDAVPAEIVASVMTHLASGACAARCMAVCRRWRDLVVDGGRRGLWRRAAYGAASREGLAGPWLDRAAAERGWLWVWCALEPLVGPDGQRRRVGRLAYGDRGAVCGEFRRGSRSATEGYGFHVSPCGGWAVGRYREGALDGQGIAVWPTGTRYEGMLRGGQAHGWGTRTYPNGNVHEGQFRDGKRDGAGVSTHTDEADAWRRWVIHREGTIEGPAVIVRSPHIIERCSRVDRSLFTDPVDYVSEVRDVARLALAGALADKGDAIAGDPYAFKEERWSGGKKHGREIVRYANGDALHDYWVQGETVNDARVRFVCGPLCPEPRFRSLVIEAASWVRASLACAYGRERTLVYPHPTDAPEAFALFREYAERGLLAAPECARDAISACLAEAAERARSDARLN